MGGTTFSDHVWKPAADNSNSTVLPQIVSTGSERQGQTANTTSLSSGYNASTSVGSPEMEMISAGTMLLVIIYGVVFALSVTGNATVLYVIMRHLHCRTSTNVFIAVLSLSDLVATVVCVPLTAAKLLLPVSQDASIACVVDGVVGCLSGVLSTAMLFLLSVDRYVTTVRQRTTPFGVRSTFVVVALAISGSALLTSVWYGLRATVLSTDNGHVTSACLLTNGLREFQLMYMVVAAGCPALVMFYCAAKMFRLIVKATNAVRPANTPANQLLFHDEMQTAMTVVVMVAAFIVCRFFEFALTLFFVVMGTRPQASLRLSLSIDAAASLVVLANGAVNPLVYALRNPNVSQALGLDLGIMQQQRRRRSYIAESIVPTVATMTSPTTAHGGLKLPGERIVGDVTDASPTATAVSEIGFHQLNAHDVTSSAAIPEVIFVHHRKSSLSSNQTTSTFVSIAF